MQQNTRKEADSAAGSPWRLELEGALVCAVLLLLLLAFRPSTPPATLRLARICLPDAGAGALASLPGCSPGLVRRIQAYQRTIAPLEEVPALRMVPGIGGRRLHEWTPWIRSQGGTR